MDLVDNTGERLKNRLANEIKEGILSCNGSIKYCVRAEMESALQSFIREFASEVLYCEIYYDVEGYSTLYKWENDQLIEDLSPFKGQKNDLNYEFKVIQKQNSSLKEKIYSKEDFRSLLYDLDIEDRTLICKRKGIEEKDLTRHITDWIRPHEYFDKLLKHIIDFQAEFKGDIFTFDISVKDIDVERVDGMMGMLRRFHEVLFCLHHREYFYFR